MLHSSIGLMAGLASLGLICAIYYCNIRAPERSWLRSEMVAMVLLALLVGLFPLALGASVYELWAAQAGGLSLSWLEQSGLNLAGLAAVLATVLVLRATLKATWRNRSMGDNVTPFPTRPVTPSPISPRGLNKAA